MAWAGSHLGAIEANSGVAVAIGARWNSREASRAAMRLRMRLRKKARRIREQPSTEASGFSLGAGRSHEAISSIGSARARSRSVKPRQRSHVRSASWTMDDGGEGLARIGLSEAYCACRWRAWDQDDEAAQI